MAIPVADAGAATLAADVAGAATPVAVDGADNPATAAAAADFDQDSTTVVSKTGALSTSTMDAVIAKCMAAACYWYACRCRHPHTKTDVDDIDTKWYAHQLVFFIHHYLA